MSEFAYLSPQEIRTLIPADTSAVGLMASYQREPDIDHNLIHYLNNLSRHFDVLVMLTNERSVANRGDLPANCSLQFVPNVCFDFGMWSRVLHVLPYEDYPSLRRLGLFNDSCFVVSDFQSCFERAAISCFELWGLVPNREIAPHIQSFFIVAEDARTVAKVCDFFRGMNMDEYLDADKVRIVRDFEVGFSRYMTNFVDLNTIYDYGQLEVIKTGITNGFLQNLPNMSYHHWDVLLAMGCPLLKKKRAFLSPDEEVFIQRFVQTAFYP